MTVDLDWSRVTGMGDTLSVREALIDGEYFYNVALQWRTSSQSFEIVSIDKNKAPPVVAQTLRHRLNPYAAFANLQAKRPTPH